MAAFLVRAFGYSSDGGGDLFIDEDASVFQNDNDRPGTAGVTRGCNPPINHRFCPTTSSVVASRPPFYTAPWGPSYEPSWTASVTTSSHASHDTIHGLTFSPALIGRSDAPLELSEPAGSQLPAEAQRQAEKGERAVAHRSVRYRSIGRPCSESRLSLKRNSSSADHWIYAWNDRVGLS